jgi:DNA polymerase-3 subunit alpha
MGDTDRVSLLVSDARQNGIEVLPPNINISNLGFTAVRSDSEYLSNIKIAGDVNFVRYGLGALKGVGEAAVTNIIQTRNEAPFTDLYDFCQRVDRRSVNKRAFESLIKSGALDTLHTKGQKGRSELLEILPKVIEVVEQAALNSGQNSLFEEDISQEVLLNHAEQIKVWQPREKLLAEKESLGFFLSGHLFDLIDEETQKISNVSLKNITPRSEPYWIRGIISSKRKQITRRGSINIIEIDDGKEKVEVNIFNELFEKFSDRLKIDELILIFCKVDSDDYSGGYRIIAEDIMNLVDMRTRFANNISIIIKQDSSDEKLSDNQLNELKELFSTTKQDTHVGLSVLLKVEVENITYDLMLPSEWKLSPTEANFDKVIKSRNLHSIELIYN